MSLFGVLAAPWISVSLVGHFSRRGYYNTSDLQVFNRRERGGVYWFTHGLNIRACGAWLIASVIGCLFLNTRLFVGPFSDAANGIDLSWLSATVIGAALYYAALRLSPEPPGVRHDIRPADRAPTVETTEVFVAD